MSDDISFCPNGRCRRKTCMRNQMNILDRTIPHSFFVEIPPDCPYNKRDNNHGIYHVRTRKVKDDEHEKDMEPSTGRKKGTLEKKVRKSQEAQGQAL